MIPIDRIVSLILLDAEKIQSIPAPTFFESKRANYIQKRFLEIGLSDVHLDCVGNVMGEVRGQDPSKKPIVVSAHLDTVHSEAVNHQLKKSREKWIGAGIGDNTIALAVLINLANFFLINQPSTTVIFCANCCEEGRGDLKGMRVLVDELCGSPLFYLVLEGVGLGVIFNRGLGVKRYEITVSTNGGHSWGDFGEPSAIHELAKIISRFSIDDLPKAARSTYNFGKIEGGTTINSIADRAVTELDIRSEDTENLLALEKKVYFLKEDFESPKVCIDINQIGERPSGAIMADHWLVKQAQKSLRNLEITPALVTGSTDANYPLSLGYPAICVCITTGGNVHTPEEFIYLDPIKKGFLQVVNIILAAQTD